MSSMQSCFDAASESKILVFFGNCRPVSHKWKAAVERVFATKHLKRTWLRFDPKQIKTRAGTNDHHGADVEFQFYCLDPADSARAIFESYKYKNSIEEVLRIGPSLERPNMIIQIRHELNDTVLPDFRYLSDSNFNSKLEKRLDERRGVIVPRMTSHSISLLESGISRDVHGERIRRNVWKKEGRHAYWDYLGFDKLEQNRSFRSRG